MENEKMVNWLMNEMSCVYCDTCKYNCLEDNDNACDYCYRKSMGWSISKQEATSIVEHILKMKED